MAKLKRNKVLDSWALLSYFEGEREGSQVIQILKEASDGTTSLFMSVVNWGEILYVIEGRYGEKKKNEVERLIRQMPVEIIDANKDLTRRAAQLKATAKLPYADSFAAALAVALKAELVTGDKDFQHVEHKITVRWL